MTRAATLIRGDGIGPEITAATLLVLDALGAPFDWDEQSGGMSAEARDVSIGDAQITVPPTASRRSIERRSRGWAGSAPADPSSSVRARTSLPS